MEFRCGNVHLNYKLTEEEIELIEAFINRPPIKIEGEKRRTNDCSSR